MRQGCRYYSTLAAKRLELLHKLVPAARVIALPVNPDNPLAELELKAVVTADTSNRIADPCREGTQRRRARQSVR
jgi:hypothetical protein